MKNKRNETVLRNEYLKLRMWYFNESDGSLSWQGYLFIYVVNFIIHNYFTIFQVNLKIYSKDHHYAYVILTYYWE